MAVTLQQIKDEYAKELFNEPDFDTMKRIMGVCESDIDQIAKRYAEECCKATLEKAVEKLWRNNFALSTYLVLDTSNIVLL